MSDELTYWRQLDILSPETMRDVKLTLIGVGGIGSPVALLLAKMGLPDITIYDPDTIEEHNLPNQLYPHSYYNEDDREWDSTIGLSKALTLGRMIGKFAKASVKSSESKYELQPLDGIVISGVDSMAARKQIWEGIKQNAGSVPLYIEGRMGAEVGVVYSIAPQNPVHCEWYESNMLYEDSAALPIPCTAQAIIYNTWMLASVIGSQLKKFLNQEPWPTELMVDIGHYTFYTGGV